jgi:hypothetical protein
MGKVVGEPYRGKPDVRFDEASESRTGENPMSGSTRGLREGRYGSRSEAHR